MLAFRMFRIFSSATKHEKQKNNFSFVQRIATNARYPFLD